MSKLHPTRELDHPSQEGWWDANTHEVDAPEVDALERRYRQVADVDISSLLLAVNEATIRATMRRFAHERANLGTLQLDAAGEAKYRELAARPERVGKFIEWFLGIAPAALETSNQPKVALELGGRRQSGVWDLVALDALEQSIPEQIRAVDADAEVTMLKGNGSFMNYLPTPLIEGAAISSNYALLRRRRGAADIRIGDVRAKIFKESNALLLLNLLDTEVCDALLESFGDPKQDHEARHNAAYMAGQVFERAVHSPAGSSRSVVPVSAQLVIMMRRLHIT